MRGIVWMELFATNHYPNVAHFMPLVGIATSWIPTSVKCVR